jgi:hypothetical protein
MGMTIFRLSLLGHSDTVTEVRWISARTHKAALAVARKTMRKAELFGFELWREGHCIRTEMRKAVHRATDPAQRRN